MQEKVDNAHYTEINSLPKQQITINVVLGTQKAAITLPYYRELTTFDISQALKFSLQQNLNLRIDGLKDIETGEVFVWVQHDEGALSSIMFFEDSAKKFKDGKEYEVVFTDLRDAKLTPEEIQMLREQFDKMDYDGNGTISFDEIERFYTQKLKEDIESCEKICQLRILQEPDRKAEWEKSLQDMIEASKATMKFNIEALKAMDVDNSGEIDWDEYLKHEAPFVIKRRTAAPDQRNQVENERNKSPAPPESAPEPAAPDVARSKSPVPDSKLEKPIRRSNKSPQGSQNSNHLAPAQSDKRIRHLTKKSSSKLVKKSSDRNVKNRSSRNPIK